jgi:hypothetical protein
LTAPVEKVFSSTAGNAGRTKSANHDISDKFGADFGMPRKRLVQKETAPIRSGAVAIIVL